MAIKFLNNSEVTGTLSVSSISNDNATYTGIVVWDGSALKYRTKAQVKSDIGAGSGSVTSIATTSPIQGGTITMTNVGTFGNLMGTPIINQPQVAIMACGVIKKTPVVLETVDGDVIAIRHMMFLSLSYDHRVVDGALGGQFVRKVADYLEQFDNHQTI